MKHIKQYENLNNNPDVDDYILYSSTKDSYFILKIISISDTLIELKPLLYQNMNKKMIRDNRDIITWGDKSGGMEILSDNIIYFSDKLKNVITHYKFIKDTKKYNL